MTTISVTPVRWSLATHARYLTLQSVRTLLRQPFFVAISLVQPMIWLLLFGELFKRVAELPGFGATSYIDFLIPGILVMNVLFGASWSGMTFIEMIDQGTMDRMLTTPLKRGALILSSLAYNSIVTVVQTMIIFLVGWPLGASYTLPGILVSFAATILLTGAFCSISNAYALVLRSREALIGLSIMIALPLSFLSSALMAQGAAPDWIRNVSRFNPVDWAVVASREALSAAPDWGTIWANLGYLTVVALFLGYMATRAFGSYQRSI
ncbi:transport permease protein [Acrocarpospora corrugata]|uniref:Transport permease protein n=1 Tax=Acrocarpospora corrugata TaxID=35763 RepID=A0A5M3VZJ6_9ACTN|nr:ABC transporter permease [Acrocarpospora corrugata]GER99777.1 transport permease protein [Acrocarpospora corrugata]